MRPPLAEATLPVAGIRPTLLSRSRLVASPPRTSIDPELVAAAKRGDEESLRRLVERAYPLVRRWSLVVGDDPADVEDATQEVMVSVLRKLASFRAESGFSTWLYRVTRNVWNDRRKARLRRGRREAVSRERACAGSAGEHFRTPSEAFEADDLRARVLEAFQTLPPRQREVFDLADLQGFTSSEIAKMVGLEPSSVRVTLLKARRALRLRLIESDPDLAQEFGDDV
jgi:RNA polymerase sigma-70 factor (ECF subfamily)